MHTHTHTTLRRKSSHDPPAAGCRLGLCLAQTRQAAAPRPSLMRWRKRISRQRSPRYLLCLYISFMLCIFSFFSFCFVTTNLSPSPQKTKKRRKKKQLLYHIYKTLALSVSLSRLSVSLSLSLCLSLMNAGRCFIIVRTPGHCVDIAAGAGTGADIRTNHGQGNGD